MNKLKAILFATFVVSLLQIGLLGCGYTTTETDPPEWAPFYINNSGVTVKLIVNYLHINNEQEIKNNDTLCNYYLQENCSAPSWDVIKGNEYSEYIPAYFKIEFLSEPKVCLVYDGEAKLENDIRYWENYTFIKKIPPVLYFYSYTITSEHKAMAKEEYCQSSMDD
jgi:hypothetical protein